MLDIKIIRENPEKINELLKRRNPELSIDEIIKIDAERRKIQAQADDLRAQRKNESQKIGLMKKNGENTDAIQEEVRKLGDNIKDLEEKQAELDIKQRDLLLRTPNIPDETTSPQLLQLYVYIPLLYPAIPPAILIALTLPLLEELNIFPTSPSPTIPPAYPYLPVLMILP